MDRRVELANRELLGFPTGISGHELTGRADAQAKKFGARVVIAKAAKLMQQRRSAYGLRGTAEVIPRGPSSSPREPNTEGRRSRTSASKGPASTTAPRRWRRSSASARRSSSSAAAIRPVRRPSFSRRRPNECTCWSGDRPGRHDVAIPDSSHRGEPCDRLRTRTQIVALEGDGRLERSVAKRRSGETESHDIGHVFVMTGAHPNTGWLDGCLALDEKGFVKTDPTCRRRTWRREWPLARPPYSSKPAGLESLPSVTCAVAI